MGIAAYTGDSIFFWLQPKSFPCHRTDRKGRIDDQGQDVRNTAAPDAVDMREQNDTNHGSVRPVVGVRCWSNAAVRLRAFPKPESRAPYSERAPNLAIPYSPSRRRCWKSL